MKQKFKNFIQELGVLSLSITIAFVAIMGLSVAKGWTEPGSNPPEGNIGAPINTGTIGQIKYSYLDVRGALYGTSIKSSGAIDAVGDVCAYVNGTKKCLSTAGAANYTQGGLYGYCRFKYYSLMGSMNYTDNCSKVIYPSTCPSTTYSLNPSLSVKTCSCADGFEVVNLSQGEVLDGQVVMTYACIKK